MDFSFKNKKTEKLFSNFDVLSSKYGKRQSTKIIQRLNQFEAANSLNDIYVLQAPRLHSLKGKLKGYWAVDLIHPFRLVIEPLNGDTADLRTVTEIKIIEVIDYH